MLPPLKKRILIILAACLIQFNYSIATRVMQGGITPKLPIDIFPLSVVWVVPYTLWYPLIALAGVWLILKSGERLFRAFAAGFILTCTLGVSTFYLFPTYIIDPELPGDDIFSKTLLFLQSIDGDYAAFPSAHIYVTVILALFFDTWYPRHRWLWLFIYVMIALSTLFTQQHYILDVIGGTAYGWIGYRFGMWWITRSSLPKTHAGAVE